MLYALQKSILLNGIIFTDKLYKMIIQILRRLFKTKRKDPAHQYKIGNKKFHNSLVDSLVPNFVEIGDNFTSAPGSIILAHDASLYFHNGTYRIEKTVIGNNVFLGANAVIMPGVIVGDGVIIGAGAVVTKNVKPYTVVVGVPAREAGTVDQYIEKSQKRGVLIQAPESFKKLNQNEPLSENDLNDFRKLCNNDKN